MAALQMNHHLHGMKVMKFDNTKSSIIPHRIKCQKNDEGSREAEKSKQGRSSIGLLGGVMKLGKGLKESLSPKSKGDWKDVALMSLSFAVYVYMSQKIVCAYCAWMSMSKQLPW